MSQNRGKTDRNLHKNVIHTALNIKIRAFNKGEPKAPTLKNLKEI
jgi:hypothetical protein